MVVTNGVSEEFGWCCDDFRTTCSHLAGPGKTQVSQDCLSTGGGVRVWVGRCKVYLYRLHA